MAEPRRALPRPRLRWPVRVATVVAVAAALSVLTFAYVARQPSAVGSAPQPSPAPQSASSAAVPTPGSTSRDAEVLLDEDFNGTELDASVWNTCHWWNDDGCTISTNNELQWYRPEQVSLRDGALELTAEPGQIAASDGHTYAFRSGMVTTGPPRHRAAPKLAFTYGTVEAKLRIPAGRGLWSAMWMLPADEHSRPEIDVLEALGDDPPEMIMHLHPADEQAPSPSHRHRLSRAPISGGWHDIRLDWSPGLLRYVADGAEVWRVTGDQVPAEPMYLVFNLAVGGEFPGDPDDSTRFPATLAIDSVRISAATR